MVEEDEATRQALQQYVEAGSDLSRPMEMDFFVAVPDQAAGEAVAARAHLLGFATSVEHDDEDGAWTCYCTKTIVPEYATVVRIERELDRIGREFGGHGDGFGSFGNAPDPLEVN